MVNAEFFSAKDTESNLTFITGQVLAFNSLHFVFYISFVTLCIQNGITTYAEMFR